MVRTTTGDRYERHGVGWLCMEGEARGEYVHPGDDGFAALEAQADQAPAEEECGGVPFGGVPVLAFLVGTGGDAPCDTSGKLWLMVQEAVARGVPVLVAAEDGASERVARALLAKAEGA